MLKFYGKVANPNYTGRVQILNATTNTLILTKEFSNTEWTRNAFSFTAPGVVGQDLQVRIFHNTPGYANQHVYVDLLSMNAIVQTDAAGWTSDPSTTLSSAHRTNDPAAYPNNFRMAMTVPYLLIRGCYCFDPA